MVVSVVMHGRGGGGGVVYPKPGGVAYHGGNSYLTSNVVGGLALLSSLRSRPNICWTMALAL